MQFFDQPHAPTHQHQTGQLEASPTLRGKDPIRWILPGSGHPGTNPLPDAWRAQSGGAARREERQLQHGADLVKIHPPAGDDWAVWRDRLKRALGTTSDDFVDASLCQLQAAAQLPGSGVSETAVNAALAMIEAAAPKDEIEGALAVQAACTHTAAMAVLSRLGNGYPGERRVVAFGSAAARLLRAFTCQVEVLRRLRHGGRQYVRVEHVHVNDGGQAVIGNVGASPGRRGGAESQDAESERSADIITD
jgi:hypothetical protein